MMFSSLFNSLCNYLFHECIAVFKTLFRSKIIGVIRVGSSPIRIKPKIIKLVYASSSEYLSSPPVFSGVHVAQSVGFCIYHFCPFSSPVVRSDSCCSIFGFLSSILSTIVCLFICYHLAMVFSILC
jgi:hypothetical protein